MLRPRRVHLLPPVSYQGGKRRQAPEIVRHMALDPEQEFWDLCAGSGAVSLELISRGHNPAKITMVDAGPWGDVWQLVGAGEFDLRTLEIICREVDVAPDKVPDALKEIALSILPTHFLAPYAFLLLQSGSFGGRSVVEKDGRWSLSYIRREAEGDKSPLNPHPRAMQARFRAILRRAEGVVGLRAGVADVSLPCACVAYCDPPYEGTARYGYDFSVKAWAEQAGRPIYVSELKPLTDNARKLRSRVSSGLNGGAVVDTSEYLSLFNADWPTPDYARVEQFTLFDSPIVMEARAG